MLKNKNHIDFSCDAEQLHVKNCQTTHQNETCHSEFILKNKIEKL
jgi:hypothetical protein